MRNFGTSSTAFRFAIFGSWLACALIVTWGFTIETAADNVKIGLAAPLSGPFAALGAEMDQAAKNAIRAINERGGLLGRMAELVVVDDACDPVQSRQAAYRLINGKVNAVIGHCPVTAQVVANLYEAAAIPFISTLTSTAQFEEKRFRHVFQLGINEFRMGEAAAGAIAKGREIGVFSGRRVAIVQDEDAFGSRVSASLAHHSQSRNLEIVLTEPLAEHSTFSIHLENMRPDILFFATRDPTRILRYFRNRRPPAAVMTIGTPIASNKSWDQFWQWAEQHRDKIFILAPSLAVGRDPGIMPLDRTLSEWEAAYGGTFDGPTMVQIYVLTAFDLLSQTIEKAHSTHVDALSAELRAVPRPTLLGSLRAFETGELGPTQFRLFSTPFGGKKMDQWRPSTAFAMEYYAAYGKRIGGQEQGHPGLPDEGPGEGGDRGKAVYNIEVDPKENVEPLVLKPQQMTVVNFFIGARSAQSVAGDIEPSPLLDALARGEPIELTVTLFSYVSRSDTYQQRKIMFDPARGGSDVASFELIPDPDAVRDNNGLGQLIFVVDAGGMEIDIIKMLAFVGTPSQAALEMYKPPVKLSLTSIDAVEVSMPDLVISIAPQGDGNLPVVIRPILDELKAKFRQALGGSGKETWVFKSGLTKPDLDELVGNTYVALREMVERKNETLQEIYKHIGEHVTIGSGGSLLKFSDADTGNMLQALQSKGANLYYRLFLRGDAALGRAMAIIDSFAHPRALRVRVLAANVYAPWQIFCPPQSGGVDPGKFWGFRYELGALQLVDSAQGRTKTIMRKPKAQEILFATWRRTGPNDQVADRAEMIARHINGIIGGTIPIADGRDDFLNRIRSGARGIKLIFAYGHGSSGSELLVYKSEAGDKLIVQAPNITGPAFIFSRDDYLTPVRLDELNFGHETHFLQSQPFVVLNACETGTPGTRTASNNGFVGALTRSGARAIFVTEGPVWANFAHHFGQDLIDQLFAGKTAREALLIARLKHLREWNNPLGLLYALYGNAGARMMD